MFTGAVFAQNSGSIKGTILDKATQEALIGATVVLEGTTKGAVSDIDGAFFIESLEEGVYKLRVSYVGYDTRLVEDIKVSSGQTTEVNVILTESAGELEAVEIVAFAKTNTEASVMLEMKNTSLIASGVSAQQIAKTLDRDAAQVVKRVPGVTLLGNFINIRGLNPRYNNVLLQNLSAPSMETDIKSFSFDMIPSGQIDRIIILKSPSAEVTGDFAGGIVKVFTRSIPNENFYNFSYTTSYRAGTTFQDFAAPKHGGIFALGFDNYHRLPSNFPADVNSLDAAGLEKAGKSFNNDWVAQKKTALPEQRFAFSMGHRILTKWGMIGEVTALNYSYANTIFDIKRADYNIYDRINDASSVIYNFDDVQNTTTAKLSLIHNWAFKLRKNNAIEFKNLANFQSLGQYVFRTGQHYEFNYFPNNHSFDQQFKGLYSGQIIGKHEFNNDAAHIDWSTGFSTTFRNQPDYKRYRSDLDTTTGEVALFIPIGNAQPDFLGRFFSQMNEYLVSANVNFSYKIGYNKSKSFVPILYAGATAERKDRTFTARNMGFIRSPQFDISLLGKTIDELFAEENINNTTGIKLDEQTNPSDSYDANTLLLAPYAKIELPIKKLKIVAGLRYEYFVQKLSSADFTNRPIEVNRPNNFVLPSVNISYSFSPKMLVRAAYGMSINNPEFREIAPFGFYDFNYNFTFRGNPNILSSKVQNAELKWELYPQNNEVINVSVFYKHFQNPIEVVVVPGAGSGGAKSFTFNNAETASLYGAEIEIKKGFTTSASKFFQRTGVMFNASYIRSMVNLGEISNGQSDNRPMQGQSPYLVNGGIFYHDKDHNYQINVLYNVYGKKIMFVGFDDYPDIYEMPRHSLDFSASYLFPKNVEISFGIADILNNKVQWIQDANGDGKFEANKDQQIQSYRPGQVVSVGVKYNFK